MDYLKAYKQAFLSLPEGAREAEVNAETHKVLDIAVEEGKITEMETSEKMVLFVRVIGEKAGYVYTEDLTEDASLVLKKAYENSFCSNRERPEVLNHEPKVFCYEKEEAVSDPKTLEACAGRMEKEILAKSRLIEEVHVSMKAETVGLRTINSLGLDVECTTPLYLMRVTANAREGEKNYTAFYNKTAKNPGDFCSEEFALSLEAEIKSQFCPAPSFPSGEYPAILSKGVVRNIFVTAWQLFSGYKYEEKSTALAGMLSERVGKEVLNITDYPVHPESGFVMKCDCEGREGKTVKIVENGVFTGVMTNGTAAEHLGLPASGNAGRRPLLSGNIGTDILVTPKNFVIEPGKSGLEEMMEHMGDGVYITVSYDVFHTVNISSGDFSIPCKGTLIRNGKEAENVKSLSISGNLIELLQSVEEVGNDLYLSPMEELENYGIGTPSFRVRSLKISGE